MQSRAASDHHVAGRADVGAAQHAARPFAVSSLWEAGGRRIAAGLLQQLVYGHKLGVPGALHYRMLGWAGLISTCKFACS